MQTRVLGRTGLAVTQLGFGALAPALGGTNRGRGGIRPRVRFILGFVEGEVTNDGSNYQPIEEDFHDNGLGTEK